MAAEDVHVESSAPDENVTLTAFKLILEDVNNPSETDQHSETVFANDAAIHNEACTGSAPMPDSRPASSDYNLSDDRPRAGKDKNTVLNIGVFSRAKILCLLAVIVVVWALLLVPVVIFFIPSDVADISNQTTINDTSSTSDRGQAAKVCEMYAGSICREELLSLTLCYLGNADESNDHDPISVETTSHIQEAEQALLYFSLIVTPQCSVEVKPFLCLYFFGLCDPVTGVSYLPSISQCKNLRDNVCMEEWKAAVNFGLALPDCDVEFSEERLPCVDGGESGSGLLLPAVNDSEQADCSDFTCREGFYCDSETGANICLPQCGSWSQFSPSLNIAINFFILTSTCCGMIGGIGVLIVAGLRWKKVFVFPLILVVYQSITLLVIGVFVVISYVDNRSLYCTVDNLYLTLSQSTPFCIIAGVVFYYCLSQLAIFWLCHILTLFWELKFPFRARAFQRTHRMKYIHIACVLTGLLAPLVPVIATIAQFSHGKSTAEAVRGGLGFGIVRFPPILCAGRDSDTTFYSLILPLSVILMVGMTFLVLVFWIIHKQHGLFQARHSRKTHVLSIGTAERKILIVFVYYVFFAFLSMLTYSQLNRDSEPHARALLSYFECERNGYDPDNPCDTSGYERFIATTVLASIGYVLIGLYPLLNLVFVVNVQEFKQMLKKHFPYLARKNNLPKVDVIL